MRKASRILGIVGGVAAILISIFPMGFGAMFSMAYPEIAETSIEQSHSNGEMSIYSDVEEMSEGIKLAGTIFVGLGVAIFVAGILGLVGGILVKKHNIAAGILMIFASLVTLFTVWASMSFLVLLLGGIFAFVKEKPQEVPPQVEAEV